jgi:hypothetical protein
MTTMRAKMAVGMVQQHRTRDWNPATKQYEGEGVVTMETLAMHAVAAPKYDASGLDEDNTYAKMSPGASLSINIANPALIGKFHVGQRFYVDFVPVPEGK